MRERSLNVFAAGAIVHPTLGKHNDELPPILRVSHTHQVKHIRMGKETMLGSY